MKLKKYIAEQAVLPEDFAKWNANQMRALELAKELKGCVDETLDRYREFVTFARLNLTPKEVPLILVKAGFREDVASRIKVVAFAEQPVFEQYTAKQIGFNVALEKARQDKANKKGRGRKVDYWSPVLGKVKRYVEKSGKAKCSTVGNHVVIVAHFNEIETAVRSYLEQKAAEGKKS